MDGIIFDMDGTLWDTVDVVASAWNSVLKERKIDKVITSKEMKSCMGMLCKDIVAKLAPMVSEGDRQQLICDINEKELEILCKKGGHLFDGVMETLEYLKDKYELYIVSNCNHGYIQSFFEAHGTQKYFVDFECAGSTGLNKMENILLLAHRNGLSSYVYVGDTQHDCEAAKGAGAKFVYAKYGFGHVDTSECDEVIDSISELKELF